MIPTINVQAPTLTLAESQLALALSERTDQGDEDEECQGNQ
jgi:hypothetical protein